MSRSKFDGIESYPLFRRPPRAVRAGRNKAAKVSGWAQCPGCSLGRVALVVVGEHLVYRERSYATYSGARLTCRASALAIGTVRPGPHEVQAQGPRRCPHERPR